MGSKTKNFIAYFYIYFSYITIGILGNWVHPDYPYPLDNWKHILVFSFIMSLLIIPVTFLINSLMKPDHRRFIGMIILILFYLSIIIVSYRHFNDPAYLSFFWSGLVGITLLLLINFQDGFKKWNKKDLFHGFLIIFAIAVILYFLWGLYLGIWVFQQVQAPLSKFEQRKLIAILILTSSLAPGVLFMLWELLSLSNVFRHRFKKRYCAVKGNGCKDILVKFKGINSVFFAYPFEETYEKLMKNIKNKIDSFALERIQLFLDYKKRMSSLSKSVSFISDRMINKPHTIILPTEHVESPNYEGILFCKICKMIHSANIIFAELSSLNLNVLFELGFAIANGRKAFIFIHKGMKEIEEVPILNTLPWEEYKTAKKMEKIALFLNNELSHLLAEDPLSISKTSSGYLAYLPKKKAKPTKKSVLILLPKSSLYQTKILNILKEILTTNKRNIMFIPDECNLASASEIISRSEHIIVLLAKEKYPDKAIRISNAEISFISGLAVGLNKKVLILKETSAVKMVDLRGVTREFNSSNEYESLIHQTGEYLLGG